MSKSEKPKRTHQDGYLLGIEGQYLGKCCGGWCLDCDYIRRNIKKSKKSE